MRAPFARVIGAAAIGALVLVAGVATPAHADTGYISAQLNPETLSVLPSPGKAMTMYVFASNAQNPVVTIDPAGLGTKATMDTPSGCTATADHTVTCGGFPTVDPLETTLTLVFHATAQAVAGDTLHITSTITADNAGTSTVTSDIPVADAIDLVASPTDTENTTPVSPGDHVTMKANVSNDGSMAVHGIRLTVLSDHSLAPNQYDNCVYSAVAVYLHQFVCDMPDVVLNPGDGPLAIHDQSGNDLGFTVAPDAAGSAGAQYTFDALASAPALVQPRKRALTGHTLTLSRSVSVARAAAPVDPDPYDNLGSVFWNLTGIHRDAEAVGATTSGDVGKTVTVNVGMVDHGPAAFDAMRSGGDPAFYFIFIPPAYADVLSVPQSCASIVDINGVQYATSGAPHGTYYRCGTGDFVPVGVPQTVQIAMKITGSTGANGMVTFADKYTDPQYAFHDDNANDDTATVSVTIPHPRPPIGPPATNAPGIGPVSPIVTPPVGGRCRISETCVFPSSTP